MSIKSSKENIWWLFIDADEFPHGPSNKTLKQHLKSLPSIYRVVGSRFVNHYPNKNKFYPGSNPINTYPKALIDEIFYCDNCHTKHQLLRYDKNMPNIFTGPGYHIFASKSCPLPEPAQSIYTHHFQYREINATSKRLKKIITEKRTQKMLEKWRKDPRKLKTKDNYGSVFRPREDKHQWEIRWEKIRETYKMHESLPHWNALVPKEDAFFAGWQ
ncbi:hypothetical protein [Desulfonatronum thioautotrophicum]|uniref:hypothetical protein n=1 Tax=Desulfonatronum thioautotrophicum TaxID=617001 RepID=UPI0012947F5E|nr:hypothetical protein [Desulfonatronum thioautotrophicum]